MKSALELAALDVAAGEAARALELGRRRAIFLAARRRKERRLRRDREQLEELVFYELREVPEATPRGEFVEPGPNAEAVLGSAMSETSDRRGTGSG